MIDASRPITEYVITRTTETPMDAATACGSARTATTPERVRDGQDAEAAAGGGVREREPEGVRHVDIGAMGRCRAGSIDGVVRSGDGRALRKHGGLISWLMASDRCPGTVLGRGSHWGRQRRTRHGHRVPTTGSSVVCVRGASLGRRIGVVGQRCSAPIGRRMVSSRGSGGGTGGQPYRRRRRAVVVEGACLRGDGGSTRRPQRRE